jgi:hypothetical protein
MIRPNTANWFSSIWIGIAVALALSALWPEREPAQDTPLPPAPGGPAPKAP